jgi:hypothetical protein
MIRLIIGSAVAAVAMLLLSYIVHMTPLAGAGAGNVGTVEALAIQRELALDLKETGTYRVPDPNTAEQTGLFAQGPVATIAYNSAGGATLGITSMRYVYALVLNFLVALGIGAALIVFDRKVASFSTRWRAALLSGFAASAFIHFSRPIWMMEDWRTALFGTIADGLILAAGGVIVAWFTPRVRERAAGEPPSEIRSEARVETLE